MEMRNQEVAFLPPEAVSGSHLIKIAPFLYCLDTVIFNIQQLVPNSLVKRGCGNSIQEHKSLFHLLCSHQPLWWWLYWKKSELAYFTQSIC